MICPFVNMDVNVDFFIGDYTNLVTCQIKAIERYLKEVLVTHHRDNIHKTADGHEMRDIRSVKHITNFEGVSDLPLECGPAFYALKYAYKVEEIPHLFTVSRNFDTQWVQQVRNGHFHIHQIETIADAMKKRTQTAYWLMHIILCLKEKGIV